MEPTLNDVPTLKDLIDTHEKHKSATSLQVSLGDGFLFEKNEIYRNVRKAFERAGYRHVQSFYDSEHVLSLANIYKTFTTKKHLYRDNFTVLTELERNSPGFFTFGEITDLKKNFMVFNSCRCVFYEAAKAEGVAIRGPGREAALAYVMMESFASAAEFLCFARSDSNFHDIVLWHNSVPIYGEYKSTREAIRSSAKKFGIRNTFKMLFASQLFCRFFYSNLGEKAVALVGNVFVPEVDPAELLTEESTFVMNSAFLSDETYRRELSRFLMKWLGFEDYVKALEFNFLKVLSENEKLMGFVDKMAIVLEKGVWNS